MFLRCEFLLASIGVSLVCYRGLCFFLEILCSYLGLLRLYTRLPRLCSDSTVSCRLASESKELRGSLKP